MTHAALLLAFDLQLLVELDAPIGKNNGTIGGHVYATVGESHGVLVKVSKISAAKTFPAVAPSDGSSKTDEVNAVTLDRVEQERDLLRAQLEDQRRQIEVIQEKARLTAAREQAERETALMQIEEEEKNARVVAEQERARVEQERVLLRAQLEEQQRQIEVIQEKARLTAAREQAERETALMQIEEEEKNARVVAEQERARVEQERDLLRAQLEEQQRQIEAVQEKARLTAAREQLQAEQETALMQIEEAEKNARVAAEQEHLRVEKESGLLRAQLEEQRRQIEAVQEKARLTAAREQLQAEQETALRQREEEEKKARVTAEQERVRGEKESGLVRAQLEGQRRQIEAGQEKARRTAAREQHDAEQETALLRAQIEQLQSQNNTKHQSHQWQPHPLPRSDDQQQPRPLPRSDNQPPQQPRPFSNKQQPQPLPRVSELQAQLEKMRFLPEDFVPGMTAEPPHDAGSSGNTVRTFEFSKTEAGFGMSIQGPKAGEESGAVFIKKAIETGPAFQCGVRAGMRILSLNGNDVRVQTQPVVVGILNQLQSSTTAGTLILDVLNAAAAEPRTAWKSASAESPQVAPELPGYLPPASEQDDDRARLHAEEEARFARAQELLSQGRDAEALQVHQQSLEIKVATVGFDHASVGPLHNKMASISKTQGNFTQALVSYKKSLEVVTINFGAGHKNAGASSHCSSTRSPCFHLDHVTGKATCSLLASVILFA